jgi:hypothetical protein
MLADQPRPVAVELGRHGDAAYLVGLAADGLQFGGHGGAHSQSAQPLHPAVVGALHGAGAIELDALATAYVPALAHCGYAGATVRHLLDMRSGIAFSDNYLHPTAEIHVLDQAIGWAPRSGPDVPCTLRDFLLTLRQKSAHGGPFEYRSCETDVSAGSARSPAASGCPN